MTSVKKKNSALYLIFFVLSVIVFLSVSYFCKLNNQSPDNHLRYFNFFGIFYKDMFYACISSYASGIIVTELLKCLASDKKASPEIKHTAALLAAGLLASWLECVISSILFAHTRSFFTTAVIHITVSAVLGALSFADVRKENLSYGI